MSQSTIQSQPLESATPGANQRTTCRVCDAPLELIFTLGEQYLSGFVSPSEPDGPKVPLDMMLCSNCKLLQLRHTVSGDMMYQTYWYRSGTNQTMRTALADIANIAEGLMKLREGDTVLDIGCNDGTLLASYKTPGLYKVGFDPAQNLTEFSRKVASKVVTGFFESEAFHREPELTDRRPKVVTSIAMFYDLEDPNKFVADIKSVMDPDGVWILQMSYLPHMLKQHDFGNICHEHLEYYSLRALEYLLDRHGFAIIDVQLNDVNGGSLRAYIRSRDAAESAFADAKYRRDALQRVTDLRNQEVEMCLHEVEPYREFAAWIDRIKSDVFHFICENVGRGKKVFVYGASTKGNVMLQYFGLDHRLIAGASERNPDKWGKMTVGTRIPIVSEADARKANPEFFLVLPWHFLEEFRDREKDYLLGGGRFIVPCPHFALI